MWKVEKRKRIKYKIASVRKNSANTVLMHSIITYLLLRLLLIINYYYLLHNL